MKFMITLSLLMTLSFSVAASDHAGHEKKEMKKDTVALKVKPSASKVKWTGKKPLGEHWGHVNVKEGMLKMDGEDIVGGKIVVDMTTINVKDIKDAKSRGDLEGHLKNADFFNVNSKSGKEAIYTIDMVKPAKGGGVDVYGKMTIKGMTKPLKFNANIDRKTKGMVRLKGNLVFDRTDYDIKYKSKKFGTIGDKFIYDDVSLEVDVVAQL